MMMMVVAFFFIGIVFGSFYNVVSLRTLSKENLAYPPSHCTTCGHNLSVLDLFPVISYLFLRGKCRYCKAKISIVYPAIELLTGASYALIIYQFGFSFEALIQIAFITIMILATASDLKEMTVPDRFVIIGVVLVLLLRVIHGEDLLQYVIGGVIAFSALLLILLLSKGRMGGADVKLYGLIGLSIGWVDSLASLFYASMIALLFYLAVAILNKGKFDTKKEIPFVPFITLGVLCTYFLTIFNFQ